MNMNSVLPIGETEDSSSTMGAKSKGQMGLLCQQVHSWAHGLHLRPYLPAWPGSMMQRVKGRAQYYVAAIKHLLQLEPTKTCAT